MSLDDQLHKVNHHNCNSEVGTKETPLFNVIKSYGWVTENVR